MNNELERLLQEGNSQTIDLEIAELEEALGRIWEIAGEFGLDPFPIEFEVVPPVIMHEMAAYGIPGRYSHWTAGRAFRQIKTQYDYGLSRIYELVINSDPAKVYLLENNQPIDNILVMAHALAHVDFFKHNQQFAQTRRDMPVASSLSADRVRQHESEVGREVVEKSLDAALAIKEHINPYRFYRPTPNEQIKRWKDQLKERQEKIPPKNDFDDLFEMGKSKLEPAALPKLTIPLDPDCDILGVIRDFCPYLEEWQRDLIDIVRAESFYFYPQRRTKIMNEGWASFWHMTIMREMADRNYLKDNKEEKWWKMNAGVVAPSGRGLNPYYFGRVMFQSILDYYNGNLSDEERRWAEREEVQIYPKFDGDLKNSPGLQRLFDVREVEDDQSFIGSYFNWMVANRMHTYLYHKEKEGDHNVYRVKDKEWKNIRDGLVASLSNCGNPYLEVVDTDYGQKNELFIKHQFEGIELDVPYLEKTLPYIYYLWPRPVHLSTVVENKPVTFTFDGSKVTSQ